MAEHKVEHVSSGEVKEFSAIKGQGKSGCGPSGKDYAEKPAIVGVLDKNKKEQNPGA